MSDAPLINPWTRPDHVVDIHFDCEFVDQGNAGLDFISIGAVIVGNQGRSNFYGVDKDFFKSKVFFDTFHPKSDKEKEQSGWMLANVWRHITGTAVAGSDHGKGSVSSLYDILSKDGAVFTPDFDQTYPIKKDDDTEESGNEPDVTVVGKIGNIAKAILETVEDVRAKDLGDDNVTRIWTYYGAHDMVCLDNLFGGMLSVPETFNYYSYDFRSLGDIFGYSHDELNPNTPHCAMSDAIAQYEMAQKLRKMIARDYGKKFVPNPNQEW
jgi:hypothetical protein